MSWKKSSLTLWKEATMASNSTLQLVDERGWRSGFANMMRLENGRWWRTRRWWVQSLIWLVVLNGLLVFALWIGPMIEAGEAGSGAVEASWRVNMSDEEAAEAFTVVLALMGTLPVFGVLIMTQGALVDEKQSGTAAWTLSSPVSRSGFVLAKLIANAIGFLVTVVVLQGLIAHLLFLLGAGRFLPPMPIAVALSLHALHLLFYLCLALMLGALFNSRGPVLAIPIAVLIGQNILEGLARGFAPWFPWDILPRHVPELAMIAAQGNPLPSFVPIVSVAVFSLMFVGLAIWRFEREEF
jgi:ABC-type Na+ efflux pump permease subunit